MSEWKEGEPCKCCGITLKRCPSCDQLWPITPKHNVCTDCWIDGKGK